MNPLRKALNQAVKALNQDLTQRVEAVATMRQRLWDLEHTFIPGDMVVDSRGHLYEVVEVLERDHVLLQPHPKGFQHNANRFAFALATKADLPG